MYNYTLLEKFLFMPRRFNLTNLIKELDGKTVLITGASSGIGKELALLFGKARVHLILVARRQEELQRIGAEIEKGNASVSIFPADLRNEKDMGSLLAFLHGLPNGLDIVINNAGLSINRPILKSLGRYHDFTRTMAINYFAPVQLLLSAIPLLAKKNGHIVNVSTINALLHPVPYWAAYQASKGAFDTWLRSAAPELNASGISISTIYLPLVKTPMIAPTAAYLGKPAMSPVHVADLIGNAICRKRKVYKPWWLGLGQLASLFFRTPLEVVVSRLVRKKEVGTDGE
ncbi:SDR family NAD(P)-dependent oxidoreductase [Planomicrobium chinense]|uniref:SDR family NAD(P)-dependent oxidoreductase n=1 Tax=Planococcus chinensis TaxID=272917 RepID=UPI001CC743F8|nr:SDR family NAD(P)-dependent oxidoreductase [Planococcus chinensis]MBZ5201809.1 SDR family NAD(P)-dependent oxidoreductase [Planococcus chinensis]